MKRSERIVAITKTLMENPSTILSLGQFATEFDAAKSTISEDLSLIKETMAGTGSGIVETLPGATGGVRFLPSRGPAQTAALVNQLCELIGSPDRILPGGFVYMADIVFSPVWASTMGEIFATHFQSSGAQYVLTVETKGIPVALCTARCLGVPLVVSRRDPRAMEGTSVSINYVSGSSGRIETMALPKRALKPGSKVLVIDDFMKGGGTAKGMADLIKEFGAHHVGTGVLVEMAEPQKKTVSDYVSILVLYSVDEDRRLIDVRPSQRLVHQRA
jgi:purine operon repressor